MLEKIQEIKTGDSYGVSYRTDKTIVQVIKTRQPLLSHKPPRIRVSSLEIQTVGINLKLEKLVFNNSKVKWLHIIGGKKESINLEERGKIRILKKYAKRFKDIFESSELMSAKLGGYFAELRDYM